MSDIILIGVALLIALELAVMTHSRNITKKLNKIQKDLDEIKAQRT